MTAAPRRVLAAALFGAAVGVASSGPLQRALPADMVYRLRPGAIYLFAAREPAAAPRTQVRLLRVDDDGLHHPLPWVRVLEGPNAGQRLHVGRSELRESATPVLGAATLIALLLSLAAGAAFWAFVTVQRGRSTAPRQAE